APKMPHVTRELVANVLNALNGMTRLDDEVPMPSMLPDGTERNIVAVANGLLDLDAEGGTPLLRDHTPDWFSPVCLPYGYDPDAKWPEWEALLQRCLDGDPERLALMQEFFGYCLIRSTEMQSALILVGEGANGKSVVLTVLRAMLGEENVSAVGLESFGQRFALAQTEGKLVNICPEIGEIDRTAEGLLKSFITGEAMTFERKGRDGYQATPTARLVIATNNVPRFSDKSSGIWRRLHLMPFTVQIPERERRHELTTKHFWSRAPGELAGVRRWWLAGLARLKANGSHFTQPEACRAALESHRLESDPARAFLLEHYTADPEGGPLETAAMYREFKDWCME